MQKLKEAVRQRIIAAALDEFTRHGFDNASMRDISKAAGISVSNTYNYYKNKEELFEGIMQPVYDAVKNLFRQSLMQAAQKAAAGGSALVSIDDIFRKIVQMEAGPRRLFIILCEHSAGTKYEKAKEEMLVLLRMLLAEAARQAGGAAQTDETRTYLLTIIADNYLDGFLKVLKDSPDPVKTEATMKALLAYHTGGIKALAG